MQRMAGVSMHTPPKHIKKIPVEVSWMLILKGFFNFLGVAFAYFFTHLKDSLDLLFNLGLVNVFSVLTC